MRFEQPIRVAVTYRVCQHWRAHIFANLNAREDLEVAVFHGQSIPNTKLVNGEDLRGFEHCEHFTLTVPCARNWVVHPFIWRTLWKYRPDVILAEGGSNFLSNVFVLMYAKLFRRPVIWWTLGELRGRTYNGLLHRSYRRLVVLQEKLSNVYLGYSTVALEYFRKMGFAEEDCFVAVNCVDTNRIFENIEVRKQEAAELRTRYKLEGKKVIVFVGAFTIQKRIDRLLRVFAKIGDQLPNTILLIVGDGTIRSDLELLACKLGVSDRIIFTGKVIENVSDYYEMGDVFVLPGLGGLAISEAMAHAMPVICTVADGCEVDLVVNGETGFRLFSDDDEEVEEYLGQKLLEIISDDHRLAEMSRNALKRIQETHNVNTYGEKIVDAIKHAKRKFRPNC